MCIYFFLKIIFVVENSKKRKSAQSLCEKSERSESNSVKGFVLICYGFFICQKIY